MVNHIQKPTILKILNYCDNPSYKSKETFPPLFTKILFEIKTESSKNGSNDPQLK
jgi:hypothetical protein